ncbi:hypothetical protein [Zoogloea sp.]|uniref:hypothetical protein n=1 Tax=Zoogloea sp. TaxID=49181 RepID=UPI0035AFAA8B
MAHLTVTLSEQDKALLHSIATETRRTDEDIAAAALKSYVHWQAEYLRRVKAGLAAAEQGQVVTNDELNALFDRLDQEEGLAP